jgi:hypothetical protein
MQDSVAQKALAVISHDIVCKSTESTVVGGGWWLLGESEGLELRRNKRNGGGEMQTSIYGAFASLILHHRVLRLQ